MKKKGLEYYLAASVSLITFMVYLSSLHNEFILWDDDLNVTNNPYIRSLDFTFFRWAFLDFSAPGADYWRPISYLSHALDYALWGLNPLGHHLTNNILHSANAFLVVLLVARLLEVGRRPTGTPLQFTNPASQFTLIAAAVTGLLFGLHPLNVESAAWVSERKNLLCALFFLLGLSMYARYADAKSMQSAEGRGHGEKDNMRRAVSPMRYALCPLLSFKGAFLSAICFFILALMSKPMAVTFPFILLILDWYPFKRIYSMKTLGTVTLEKLPLISLSIVSSVVTVLAQSSIVMASTKAIPLSSRLLVGARSLIAYLGKIVLPLNLIPFYPYPKSVSFLSFGYLLPVVLVTVITITCTVIAKKHKLGLSVWGYYVMTLIPMLGILQTGGQSMADRYTYLAGLGPFVLMGLGAAWVWEKLNTLNRWRLFAKYAYAAVIILSFSYMSYLTHKQIGIWKDSIIFWSYVIEKEPARVPVAYSNRCACLSEMGQLEKAILDCDMAIAVSPSYHMAYNNRGNIYLKTGMDDRAIADFDKAIALNPSFPNAYNNRGNAFGKTGQFEKAIADYDRAIALNPGFQAAYFNRGLMHLKTHNKEIAISDFQKACDLGSEIGCKSLHDLKSMSAD